MPVLIAIVAVGIVVVVLVVHLTGGSHTAKIANEDAAVERFLIDYPDVEVRQCFLSWDRRDAVLELEDGQVGLVHAVGVNFLTRLVKRGEMTARAGVSDESAVDLETGDVAWPRARMHFADSAMARTVVALFDKKVDTTDNKRAA
ncbi:hypothetical protein [Oricola thermophila]|uniref:Uncharacterized protein n=1 Tax=Oricola thermophila TaxID=2742145 RepID=A0A6N1V9T1_9HYPH|nr:hypothetical protein [Oricola thermophila]QKV17761.1 hypothetical protein HTY61_04420 [Oricola thermophila]